MLGGYEFLSWDCSDEEPLPDEPDEDTDVDSDSSEYRRELEIALYCQIHHDTVADSQILCTTFGGESFTLEKTENNGNGPKQDSSIDEKCVIADANKSASAVGHAAAVDSTARTVKSEENSLKDFDVIEQQVSIAKLGKLKPNSTSTPSCDVRTEKEKTSKRIKLKRGNRKDKPVPQIEDFLHRSEETMSLPKSTKVKAGKERKTKKKEVITLSSDVSSDTDVVVQEHLRNGEPQPLKRKRSWSGPKKADIDLTMVDDDDSSESDVMEVKGETGKDDDIVIHVDRTGRKKIVLDAAELSDFEDLCNLDKDAKWTIIDTDRYPQMSLSNRYYGRPNVECHNCGVKGHLSRDCEKPRKQPVCILCGKHGHIARTCPNSVCYRCEQPGHAAKNCRNNPRRPEDQCYRCRYWGHRRTECSDLWRQFHFTTHPGKLIKSRNEKNKNVFCFNCGSEGHFGHECAATMMNEWSKFPYSPFISRYDKIILTEDRKRKFSIDFDQPPQNKRKRFDSPVPSTSTNWANMSQDLQAQRDKNEKGQKKSEKFEEKYGTEDFPRSNFGAQQSGDSFTSKKEKYKKIKEEKKKAKEEERALKKTLKNRQRKKAHKKYIKKKAVLAAMDARKKERKAKKGKKSQSAEGKFESKWVQSEAGHWQYGGSSKGRTRVKQEPQSDRGFKFKLGKAKGKR